MVERLLESVQTRRVLLLLTFRPNFTLSWQGQAHTTSLVLNRMGHHETQVMVEAVTEGKVLADDVIGQMTTLFFFAGECGGGGDTEPGRPPAGYREEK